MDDFQESLSASSSLSLSSFSSSPNPDRSSPSSSLASSSYFPSLSIPNPLSIDGELWLIAERRIQEILCTIQPALVSEERRKSIIDYVQMVVKDYHGIEVFPFGSVPLKTYLPDGDVDLTALCHQRVEEDLAKYLCKVFQDDQHDSEFLIQDVQHIHAQVSIVKCIVNDIQVDISFNQMAGLSTLCFLEQIDQLVGKDHLFKRSIILIKAWCYYESRILGAHRGLLSTYALETLVLYIINLFHSSLWGPLAVLYKFLDYYSTFDWDNYCVSINGAVAISSLPEVQVEITGNYEDDLLFSLEFLRHCREIFSDTIQSTETRGNEFPIKHLNIMDPLKNENNLGRSVSKGNFHRIRCALSYGAERLLEVLMLPGESMGVGLEKFFVNTLNRNGKGQRADCQIPVPAFGIGRSEVSDLSGDYDVFYNDLQYGHWCHNYALHVPAGPKSGSLSIQSQKKTAVDSMHRLLQCKRGVFCGRGTDVFVPRVCHPQSSDATFQVNEMGKSRGTGTFIPDKALTHQSYRDYLRARNPESATHGLLPKSPKKKDEVEDSLEMNISENGGCLDLSLEQFPVLPAIKKPIYSDQSTQSILKSSGPESCSHPLQNITFGIYEPQAKQADTGFPTTTASKPGVPRMEMQEQNGASAIGEARVALLPYLLKDKEDFPPL